MKSKKFPPINCYILTATASLIGLALVFSLLHKSSVNERDSVFVFGLKSENVLGILTNSIPLYNNLSILNNDESFGNNTHPESETIPINQNKTLVSNLKKSNDQTNRNGSDILLYRKRRYLIFPEGSSFQIVFDLIIPIVDYTNYAIMGITCAVAWELPSKPPSEIEDDFITKLNDGTYGLSRNDSVSNIEYVDTPQNQRPSNDHLSNIIYIQPSEYGYQGPSYSQTHKEYGTPNRYRPVYNSSHQPKPVYYTKNYGNPPPFKLKSINNERIDTGRPNFSQRPRVRVKELNPKSRQTVIGPKQHAVYHIMGRRSPSPSTETHPVLQKLDKIHLQYHRSSRLELYSKIEVMFEKQGKNGTECVLRGLCEFGQRKHDTEPGEFLMEIFRAIFTLPKGEPHKTHHPKHKAWDEAHWNDQNCAEMYPSCEDLSWSKK